MSISGINKPTAGNTPSEYPDKVTDSLNAIDVHTHDGSGDGAQVDRVDLDAVDDVTVGLGTNNSIEVKDGGIDGSVLAADTVDDVTVEVNVSNKLAIKDDGVTEEKKASRAHTTDGSDPGSGGVVETAGITSTQSNSSTITYDDITNCELTLTTEGNPVFISIQSNNTFGNDPAAKGNTGTGSVNGGIEIRLQRNTDGGGYTDVCVQRARFDMSGAINMNSLSFPATGFKHVDPVAAGTHQYKLQFRCYAGGNNSQVERFKLVALEII